MKNVIKLGEVLSKKDQKQITGGFLQDRCSNSIQIAWCIDDSECPGESFCCPLGNCSF